MLAVSPESSALDMSGIMEAYWHLSAKRFVDSSCMMTDRWEMTCPLCILDQPPEIIWLEQRAAGEIARSSARCHVQAHQRWHASPGSFRLNSWMYESKYIIIIMYVSLPPNLELLYGESGVATAEAWSGNAQGRAVAGLGETRRHLCEFGSYEQCQPNSFHRCTRGR